MLKTILKMSLSALIALIMCGGAYIGGTLFNINHNMTTSYNAQALLQMPRDPDAPAQPAEPVAPDTLPDDFYMLLLGVDSDDNRENGEESQYFDGAFRSDTIIVAHVNLNAKKVSLCSLERDIKIDLEGVGTSKLNAAYLVGGEELMRSEAEKIMSSTGPSITIPYYAVVDMDGLTAIIDSIGGIDVDVERAFWDEQLQDGLEQGGMQHLNGAQAVMYCRSRYAWDDGDFARARHQRQVLQILADRLIQGDPWTLFNTAETLSKYVATNVPIFEAGSKLKGINAHEDIYSMMTPTVSASENGISYQELYMPAWEIVLDQFIANADPAVAAAKLEQMGIMTGGIDYNGELPDPSASPQDQSQQQGGMSDVEAAEHAIASGVANDVTNANNTSTQSSSMVRPS